MGILFRADGTISSVRPSPGPEFSPAEVSAYVGGYLEAMRLDNGEVLYLNEEGKLLNLPLNGAATTYAKLHNQRYRLTSDVIVGDVLLCAPGETS